MALNRKFDYILVNEDKTKIKNLDLNGVFGKFLPAELRQSAPVYWPGYVCLYLQLPQGQVALLSSLVP